MKWYLPAVPALYSMYNKKNITVCKHWICIHMVLHMSYMCHIIVPLVFLEVIACLLPLTVRTRSPADKVEAFGESVIAKCHPKWSPVSCWLETLSGTNPNRPQKQTDHSVVKLMKAPCSPEALTGKDVHQASSLKCHIDTSKIDWIFFFT